MIQTGKVFADNWRSHFRHPNFRKGQEDALVATAKALDEGKRFIISEIPTGVGKSDIAIALAMCSNSYITTPQILLIDQYLKDFSNLKGFYNIKGKANYKCRIFDDCAVGSRRKCSYTRSEDSCTYKHERNKAAATQVVLTSTSYYMLAMRNPEIWLPRTLTVVDEAHGLESAVLEQVSMELNSYELRRLKLFTDIPEFTPEVDPTEFGKWVKALESEISNILAQIDSQGDQFSIYNKEDIEMMEELLGKIVWYIKSIDNKVEWVVDSWTSKKGNTRYVKARPIYAAYFAQEMLFKYQAEQFLLQSATIPDYRRFAADIGIELKNKGDGLFFKRPSPFPTANRPIYRWYAGSMNFNNQESTLPELLNRIERILKAFPNEKGVIHCVSGKLQQKIRDHFMFEPRMLVPESADRERMVYEHITSSQPTVLVSPSIYEGYDFKDHLARFIIIPKVPRPDWGDRRVKIRANRDRLWMDYIASRTFLQSIGRGVRSETDWCRTFVLDSEFEKMLKASGIADQYLTGCIREHSEAEQVLK